MKILLIIPVIVIVVGIFYKIILLTFKIGYYEQTLKNNSDKFSQERWAQIVRIMELKNIFKIPK